MDHIRSKIFKLIVKKIVSKHDQLRIGLASPNLGWPLRTWANSDLAGVFMNDPNFLGFAISD
jgi:hypothetical protein